MNKKESYTSADTKPVKLTNNPYVLKTIQNEGIIPPVHAQVILTNKCNLNCSFCSCSEDDRESEMGWDMAFQLIRNLISCGTKAVTITGGGEPLLHPDFSSIIELFYRAGIQIGLVTNGLLLHTISSSVLDKITWIRISHSSDRRFDGGYQSVLSSTVSGATNVDWAFSYVITKDTKAEQIIPIIKFANKHNFTHVRLVADLFEPQNIDMGQLAIEVNCLVNDKIVIYQPRKNPERGRQCYIGLLKPLISANGMIYACCGVQYALEKPSKKLPNELCLGTAGKLKEIINTVPSVDGSICHRCYYSEYNKTLKEMLDFNTTNNHKDFV